MKKQTRMSRHLIALLTLCVLFVCMAQAAAAQDAVEYYEGAWDAKTQNVDYTKKSTTEYTVLDGSVSELTTGDYVVKGSPVYPSGLSVPAGETVNLILMDGASLNVSDGFCVPEGATLNIYGQEAGTGSLTATGGSGTGSVESAGGAGIGGGRDGAAGTITIHGGTVTATGGMVGTTNAIYAGAGIGGGSNGDGGTITIYGGTVTATGARPSGNLHGFFCGGAGIGGGGNGSGGEITIYGGKVTANEGSSSNKGGGAGIGSGRYAGKAEGGKISIHGGTVNATGGEFAAGIGNSWQVKGGEITITGGTVTAMNGTGADDIGSGEDGDGGTITITGGNIMADTITDTSLIRVELKLAGADEIGNIPVYRLMDAYGNTIPYGLNDVTTLAEEKNNWLYFWMTQDACSRFDHFVAGTDKYIGSLSENGPNGMWGTFYKSDSYTVYDVHVSWAQMSYRVNLESSFVQGGGVITFFNRGNTEVKMNVKGNKLGIDLIGDNDSEAGLISIGMGEKVRVPVVITSASSVSGAIDVRFRDGNSTVSVNLPEGADACVLDSFNQYVSIPLSCTRVYDVGIEIVWDDCDNQCNTRPDKLTAKELSTGADVDIVEDENKRWHGQVNNVEHKEPQWELTPPEGYTVQLTETKDQKTTVTLYLMRYPVQIADGIEHGTVTLENGETNADFQTDQIVTLNVQPEAYYLVEWVSYNGNVITPDENGKYTFTMPAQPVTVMASFAACSHESCTYEESYLGHSHNRTCTKCGYRDTEAHSAPNENGKCICGLTLAAQVDGAYFDEIGLDRAIAAWNTDGAKKLTLLDNVVIDEQVEVSGEDKVLDLNGKTWERWASGDLVVSGELTIQDSSTGGNLYAIDGSPTLIKNSGRLTITGDVQLLPLGVGALRMEAGEVDLGGATNCKGWKLEAGQIGIFEPGNLMLPEGYCLITTGGKETTSVAPYDSATIDTRHEHNWGYSPKADQTHIIEASCTGEGECPIKKAEITLTAPDDPVYSGMRWDADVEVAPMTGTIAPTITYNDVDRTNVTGNPITASIKLGSVTASVSYTIQPMPIGLNNVTLGGFTEMTYTGEPLWPVCGVKLGSQDVTGEWSKVTDVGEKTTFTATGNFTGVIELDPGMEKANPVMGHFKMTPPQNLYYNGTAKQATVEPVSGVTGMGEITVKYSPAEPIGAGEYTVLIDVTAGANFNAVKDLNVGSFTIQTSGSEFYVVKTYLSGEECTEFTYGDTIMLNGYVKTTGAAPVMMKAVLQDDPDANPDANQVALYDADGTTQLCALSPVDNGLFKLVYDTTAKLVDPAESVTLMVKYTGNSDMAAQSTTVTIRLNEKTLKPELTGAAEKVYDGTTAVPQDNGLTIALPAKLDGDSVTASASYAYQDADAGENKTVIASGIALSGDDQRFYKLSANSASNTLGRIHKDKLVNVDTSGNTRILGVYCESDEDVYALLPQTINYYTSGGDAVPVKIVWHCPEYDNTPGSSNRFDWAIDDSQTIPNHEIADGVEKFGQFIVINVNATPVENKAQDKRITYDASAYDVSAMFEIDEHAGTPSYEILPGGTGEGALHGTMLTITKAGTFNIGLTTAAHREYSAGKAEAVLTVDKGNFTVVAPTGLTAYYGQTLSEIELPMDTLGIWRWADETALVGNVGEQTHTVFFDHKDADLWSETEVSVKVLVQRSGTDLTGTGLNHEDGKYTYGEEIVVTLMPEETGAAPVRMLRRAFNQPVEQQMALYQRTAGEADVQLTEAVSGENGVYTMTVRTVDKLLAIGENTLVAKYVGDESMANAEKTYTVTIAKKPLTIASMKTQSRYYKAGDKTVEITGAVLAGVEGADDVKLAAGQKGVLSSDVPGKYDKVLLTAPVLDGKDVSWYTIADAQSDTDVEILAIPESGFKTRVSVKADFTDADVKATALGKIPTLDTVAEIDAQLRVNVAQKGAISDGAMLYDVILEYLDVDGVWKRADREHFPKGGIEVMLPVISGTTPATHAYAVAHMFTMDMGSHKAGEVEYPVPTAYQNANGEWMLKFTVNGLSPIMVAAIPIPALPQTGDDSSILLYGSLLMLSAAALIAMKKKMKRV